MNVTRVSSLVARAAALGILLTLTASSNALAAWNPSLQVRPATFQPFHPDLAASGANVVAAWNEPALGLNPASVWTARSTNGGNSFGAATRLAKSTANAAADIAVFSAGTSHYAVWSEGVPGGGSRIFMSRATFGGSWSTATQVSSNAGPTEARDPRIVTSGNVIVLVYRANGSTSGPFSGFTRVRIGAGAWGPAAMLPGGAPGGTSVAVGANRVLIVWQNNAGTIRERRAVIGTSGTSLSWFTGDLSLGTGEMPMIVLWGTHAVVLWEHDADIYRRLSATSGATWTSQQKILDGNPSTDVDGGDPYHLYDAAMDGTRVAFTVVTGDSPDLGGQGFRMESGNTGSTWTKSASSASAGDQRQVAYLRILGVSRLAEAWLRVDGQLFPFGLRYHRQT